MGKEIITESQITEILHKILSEQTAKVRREDFNRVQFKIEELQNSLNETLKELRKLEESIPTGLRSITNARVNLISKGLWSSLRTITQLKEKVRLYKRSTYSRQQEQGENKY